MSESEGYTWDAKSPNGVDAWFKGLHVAIRGWAVLGALAICVLIGSDVYFNAMSHQDHVLLIRAELQTKQSHDMMTCVLTRLLSLPQDQKEHFGESYRPGIEHVWCPWLPIEEKP